jgi:hypothetical protein
MRNNTFRRDGTNQQSTGARPREIWYGNNYTYTLQQDMEVDNHKHCNDAKRLS